MVVLIVSVIALLAGVADYFAFCKEKNAKKAFLRIFRDLVLIDDISFLIIRFYRKTVHFLLSEFFVSYYVYIIIGLVSAFIVIASCLVAEKINCYDGNAKLGKGVKAIKVVLFVALSLLMSLFFGTRFVYQQWGGVRPEQLLINMCSPTKGTEIGIYLLGFEYVIITFCILILVGMLLFSKFTPGIRKKNKTVKLPMEVIRILLCVLLIAAVSFGVVKNSERLHLTEGYEALFVDSDFIEENYADATKTKVTFPEKKRNLIYIYLESVENSYLSKELGGYMDENLMPELTELANEGIVFSDNSGKFGGPAPITGTTWSLASMVNQNLGIPMKSDGSFSEFCTPDSFLKGAKGIGDFLEEQGYEQVVMINSDAVFGGLDLFYKTHGNFAVWDYEYAKQIGKIPQDYRVWWGFEDDKLYEYAKEELTRLYETGKPFNFVMENADTHMPDGYLPEGAPTPYESHYANTIAYSTRQVAAFVKWIQQQPFYDNTTVVLIGDHLSMDVDFFADFDESYYRTQFNLILNPADKVAGTASERFVNRKYSNMDMYPTTLAALGCDIEGDRLGLGTNLFSGRETIIEQYGYDKANAELIKRSKFYNETIAAVE